MSFTNSHPDVAQPGYGIVSREHLLLLRTGFLLHVDDAA